MRPVDYRVASLMLAAYQRHELPRTVHDGPELRRYTLSDPSLHFLRPRVRSSGDAGDYYTGVLARKSLSLTWKQATGGRIEE